MHAFIFSLPRTRPCSSTRLPRVLFHDSRAGLGGDPREIEANQFAAGLLMPEHSIAGALRQVSRAPAKFTIEDLVSRLAKQFEVSAQAMRFRLVTLGIIEPD